MDVTLKTSTIPFTQKSKSGNENQPGGATATKSPEHLNKAEVKPLSREEAEEVTEQMNKLIELINTDLQFSVHEKTKRLIVQMVDKRDGTVLKEFPPHELLDTLANIQEYVGLLLDKKA